MSWPSAKPIKNEERESSTWAELAERSLPILEKEGKYMSIDRGSKAVSDPSRMVKETLARATSDELGVRLILACPQ